MKKTLLLLSVALVLLATCGTVIAQTVTITKWPAYIPAGAADTSKAPFAIYVTVTGAAVSSQYSVKVGDPNFTVIGNLLYTMRNNGANAGTWGCTTSYNTDNFDFTTDATGAWQGWIPVKSHRSGIPQLAVRCRLFPSGNPNLQSAAVNVTGEVTAATNGGWLVGNLLDGTNGTKEDKVVLAYNGTTLKSIWFSEPDSVKHVAPPLPIDERNSEYSTAIALVNANGGYAMLTPDGTNAITKLEVYSYPNNTGAATPVASDLMVSSTQNVTIPNSVPGSGVGTATNITLTGTAPDGAGTATLQNNAGTFLGDNVFARNAGSQAVKVTVTGVGAGPLDQVKLLKPTSWSGLSAPNVTLGGAFSGSPVVTADYVLISGANLGTTPGTITITGLTSPNPVGPLLNGNDTWVVQTAAAGGTLTPINVSPVSYTLIPIHNIRSGGVDGNGNTSLGGDTTAMNGQVVAVYGVATVENGIISSSVTQTSFFIEDSSYGIQVFRIGAPVTLFSRGDQIVAKGTVTAFSGGVEVIPVSTSPDFYNLGAGTLPTPLVLSGAADVNEANEGKLIRVNSVTYDSAGRTFVVTAVGVTNDNFVTGTDRGTMWLTAANNIVGNTIPVNGDIIGIEYSRNDITGGNQVARKIAARNLIDLGVDPASGTGTASITPTVRFANLTAVAETLTVAGDGTNTLSSVSVTIPPTWTWTNPSAYSLAGTGFAGATASVNGAVITVSNAAVTNTNTGIIRIQSLNTPASLGQTTFVVRTSGTSGNLITIASSPAVNIATAFSAIKTGNWSDPTTWAGGLVPGAGDDVYLTALNDTVTIDVSGAQCRNLTMTGTGSVSNSGPLLQFISSGTPGLTVNGDLSIAGGSGPGGGDRGGRAKLYANGNTNAVLTLMKNIIVNSSNSVTNGNSGLNMDEGTVRVLGATSDTLKNASGLRLGNLVVGDGVAAKTFVSGPTLNSGRVALKSVTVKAGSTFMLGTSASSLANTIGNVSESGVPMLTGGVTIEPGASITTINASSPVTGSLNIRAGGITNNGILSLKSPDGSRHYALYIGGLVADPAGSNQTVGGSNTGTYDNVYVGALDTLNLSRQMNVDTLTLNGLLVESAGNTVRGIATTTRTVAASSLETFGGIGLELNTTSTPPGSTVVTRTTGVASGGTFTPILRYFDVAPTTNTGLNATLVFRYDDSELNSVPEANLLLFKSTDAGTTWSSAGGTVNMTDNTLTLTGVNDLSRWTAGGTGSTTTTLNVGVTTNWNMVSLPVSNPIPDDSVQHVFIHSINRYAFIYGGGYQQRFRLSNGPGYWIKSDATYTQDITGTPRDTLTIPVTNAWNMIGSISTTIDTSVAHVTPSVPGLRVSNFFKYAGGYQIVSTIQPGLGYWIKTSGAGSFFMHATGPAAKVSGGVSGRSIEDLHSLTIRDANGGMQTLYFGADGKKEIPVSMFVMPPLPPMGSFDARFETAEGGTMAQTHPEEVSDVIDLPIAIQSSAYPLTVSWKINGTSGSYELSEGAGVLHPVRGEGSLKIANSAVNHITLKVTSGSDLPKEFSLSQNYPNPFNPSTSLKYGLPVDSRVTVEIYNVLGQRVRTLMNEDSPAGRYVVEWNGTGNENQQLGSGTYFLRLSAKGVDGKAFNEVRKLMMLK